MTQKDSVVLVIEREFDAPRDLIWKAWTDPEVVAKWWGPNMMKTRVDELDLRVGGGWRYVMIAPDGSEWPQWGEYREIVPPEKLVMSATFEVGADAPHQQVITYEFAESGGKTQMTMSVEDWSVQVRDEKFAAGIISGWNANWDSLDAYLPELVAAG